MDDCTTVFEGSDWEDGRAGEPQAVGDIVAELLARYRARFPEVNIAVVEVPAAA